MSNDPTLDALNAYIAAHPSPPRRVPTDAEMAADDYWAGIGEARRDEELMEVRDDRWLQEAADNWLERSAS